MFWSKGALELMRGARVSERCFRKFGNPGFGIRESMAGMEKGSQRVRIAVATELSIATDCTILKNQLKIGFLECGIDNKKGYVQVIPGSGGCCRLAANRVT
jgi:hypothetical protein